MGLQPCDRESINSFPPCFPCFPCFPCNASPLRSEPGLNKIWVNDKNLRAEKKNMDINQINLSSAQRQTLLKIVEDTNRKCWRYSQAPASSYSKITLNVLCRHGLIKLLSCPGYLDFQGRSIKGVQLTERGEVLDSK